jgi:hypothetical protein
MAAAAASVHVTRAAAARKAPARVGSAGVARGAQSISTVKPPLVPRGERQRFSAAQSIDEADAPGRRFFPFSASGQRSDAPKFISVVRLW